MTFSPKSSPPPPRRLKILIVTHFFSSHGGGIEIVAGQLARHYQMQNLEAKVIWFASNTDTPPSPTKRFHPFAAPSWNGIEKFSGVPSPLWSPGAIGRLWRSVRRADVVHIHDYLYFGNLCAALFCRLSGTPYVITQHIGFVPFEKKWMRDVLQKLNSTLGRWVLRGATHVAFVSEEVRSYFTPILGGKSTGVIPNGVDTSLFHPFAATERDALKTRLAQKLDFEPQNKVVLFVGRFVEKKGVPLVLELAKSFPATTWILAGHGPLIPENASTPTNVRVVRGWRGSQIADLMRIADLFVLPSRGEGFPLVVQEALACGVPVLVEDSLKRALPAVAPFLETEELGQGDDLTRWCNRVRFLLSEENSSGQNAAGRAAFAKGWSWEECAQRYLALFQNPLA